MLVFPVSTDLSASWLGLKRRSQGAVGPCSPDRHQCGRGRLRHRRQDPGEGSVFVRLRQPDRRVRQPRHQGHYRPDQGGSRRDPERSLSRGAPNYHRSHGSRTAEEERRRWRRRHAPGRRDGWHGLLSLTVQRSNEKERPGSDAGPFCISYRSISATIAALR